MAADAAAAAASWDWFLFVKTGGAYVSPLLLAALIWLNGERSRLLSELEKRDEKLESLAERWLVVITELRSYLFQEQRKGS